MLASPPRTLTGVSRNIASVDVKQNVDECWYTRTLNRTPEHGAGSGASLISLLVSVDLKQHLKKRKDVGLVSMQLKPMSSQVKVLVGSVPRKCTSRQTVPFEDNCNSILVPHRCN